MPEDWLLLTPEDLDVAAVIAFVTTPAAGGIATFLGTTRTETNAQNQPLLALDYQAYPEMARAQLADLAQRARHQWPVQKLAIHHRTGTLVVGETAPAV